MNAEIRDQLLHFGAGALVTGAIGVFLPTWCAFLVMMVAAEVRELAQHNFDPLAQGVGSLRDLAFFAVGGGVAAWLL